MPRLKILRRRGLLYFGIFEKQEAQSSSQETNHNMPLHPDSRPCTAMTTPLGPMQWRVVPMGAKNGNAAFQRMMEDLLGPVRDCADPFADNVIIGCGTEDMTEDELIEAHEKDLRRVLSELDKHNMVCKPTKASLFVKEVEFAGHVVGHGQRCPMPGKLASLHHWEKCNTSMPSGNSTGTEKA